MGIRIKNEFVSRIATTYELINIASAAGIAAIVDLLFDRVKTSQVRQILTQELSS